MTHITATTQTLLQWNVFANFNGLNLGAESLAAYIRLTAGSSHRQTVKRLMNAAHLVQWELQNFCNTHNVQIPTPSQNAGYGIYINGKLA